jgi:hypothetical protein
VYRVRSSCGRFECRCAAGKVIPQQAIIGVANSFRNQLELQQVFRWKDTFLLHKKIYLGTSRYVAKRRLDIATDLGANAVASERMLRAVAQRWGL